MNKLCEKYAYDSSGDGPHEWTVRNLQSTEKALAKLGIKYTDIPKMQKMIKKEKMKKAIKNIILAPFNAAKHITGKSEPQR